MVVEPSFVSLSSFFSCFHFIFTFFSFPFPLSFSLSFFSSPFLSFPLSPFLLSPFPFSLFSSFPSSFLPFPPLSLFSFFPLHFLYFFLLFSLIFFYSSVIKYCPWLAEASPFPRPVTTLSHITACPCLSDPEEAETFVTFGSNDQEGMGGTAQLSIISAMEILQPWPPWPLPVQGKIPFHHPLDTSSVCVELAPQENGMGGVK